MLSVCSREPRLSAVHAEALHWRNLGGTRGVCFWVCSGADAYCDGGREAEVDRSVVDGDPDGRSRGADVGDGESGTDRDSVSGEVAEDVGRAIRDAQHLHGGAGFGLVESLAVIGRDPSVRVGDRKGATSVGRMLCR